METIEAEVREFATQTNHLVWEGIPWGGATTLNSESQSVADFLAIARAVGAPILYLDPDGSAAAFAANGVVHVLDKVLGIPFQTVYEKVKDDFDLSTTYKIGSHRNDFWNHLMSNVNKRYTYFAPSKAAWSELRKQMPSEYKQLVEGLLPVHGEQVS